MLTALFALQPLMFQQPPKHSMTVQHSKPITLTLQKQSQDWLPKLVAEQDGRILWSAICLYGIASRVPSTQTVYFVQRNTGEDEIVARTLTGKTLWRTNARDYCLLRAGAGKVLAVSKGPTWGVAIDDVSSWEGEEGVMGCCNVVAFDAKSGRELWRDDTLGMGAPLWTDGKVAMTLRIDGSRRAVRRVQKHGGSLPIWLECWTLTAKHRQRLWQQRLRGLPPALSRMRAVDARHVEMTFAHGRNFFPDTDFLPMKRLKITVPLSAWRLSKGTGKAIAEQ